MPQIFQVLKCYKCSIFQVHQTKKNNKWKCKVCGEKQSLKRHYGIGTGKDCRIHVQKLNNMQGNKEEIKLNTMDSDSDEANPDSDESNSDINNDVVKTENVSNINNTQLSTNNAEKDSKWSAFVEKEEICVVNEPEFIDNIEVCLELPRKRKINRKSKAFKVPKVSSTEDQNKKTEIINDINNLATYSYDTPENCSNFKDLLTDTGMHKKSSMKNSFVTNKKKIEVNIVKVNKTSKWDQYESENNDPNTNVENSSNSTEDNLTCYKSNRKNTKVINFKVNKPSKWAQYESDIDDMVENSTGDNLTDYKDHETRYNSQKEGDFQYNDVQNYFIDGFKNSQKTERDIQHSSIAPLFSLCDDNELDNILDF